MEARAKREFADSLNCARFYKPTEKVKMQGMRRSGWLMKNLRKQAGGGAQMAAEKEVDHAALQLSLERTNQPMVNAFIEL